MSQELLLLSGLLCDETIWDAICERLKPRIRVCAIAFPDFDSITAMAEHVLDRAPASFALAGHSMGGRVALEVIRIAPGRIEALALFNTGIHARRDHEPESRGRLVQLARDAGMSAVAREWLPPMMGASAARQAEVLPALVRMVERATPDSFAAQTRALLNRPDAAAVLPLVRVPTLLASGTADTWSPLAQHADMQRRLAQATLVPVQEAGHMAPVEQPQVLAAALTHWLEHHELI